jgi:glycosyltransferase involved in cell wall biosynthesis
MTTVDASRPRTHLDGSGQRLRVAVVAPPWFAVPPSGYGGIEAMVAAEVDGLVRRGHEVCLIGSGARGTLAQRFEAVHVDPPSSRLGDAVTEVLHAAEAARIVADFAPDVVHDHSLAGPLTARRHRAPMVLTVHGSVVGDNGRYLAALGTEVQLVAISEAQRRAAPRLNWVGRVHNAVDVGSFPVGSGGGGYLLFLGRFSPDKGAHLAIDAARAAGRPLVLAGKLNEPAERAFFDKMIRPRLGPDVTYVGQADAARKRELYRDASALLFPICWDEPFGLVMVEAMACGTPVIALRRGSVPEVIVDGTTGFVLDDPADLPAAVDAVDRLDRAACRLHVEQHFDVDTMVSGYERVLQRLAGPNRVAPPPIVR